MSASVQGPLPMTRERMYGRDAVVLVFTCHDGSVARRLMGGWDKEEERQPGARARGEAFNYARVLAGR